MLPKIAQLPHSRFDAGRYGVAYAFGMLAFFCVFRTTVAFEFPLADPSVTSAKALVADQQVAASQLPEQAFRSQDASSETFAPPDSGENAPIDDLNHRILALVQENARFAEQQLALQRQIESLTKRNSSPGNPRSQICQYDHERGMFTLVRGSKGHPFELSADFFTQARLTSFSRNADFWTDSTGTSFPIDNFDSTEITRNFIQFTGTAVDPKLSFTTFVFSSTALNDTLYLGWLSYRFSDAFDVRVGTWQLPGTREWYQSFRYTMGADRLMATTFFRPNISPGIWAQGQLLENVRYVFMLANSSNRFTQGVERIGSSRALSATMWWEPSGDFGAGPSDIENHAAPSWRLGGSMTYSVEANQGLGDAAVDNPEDTILRLSDGTPLFRLGALAPGVQLESANYNLWAIDAAVKFRGCSLSGEYFFRLLDDFKSRPSTLTINSLFDHGGLLEGGVFVVPSKLELFARTSRVTGKFGSGNEYGGGVNWYPRGSRELRMTAEVLQVNDSPAQNFLTGYRAGETGTLFQLQWFADF